MALIDDITIKIKAGNGGDAGRSFHTNYGSMNIIGNGGNGGRGGNIYFEGTTNLSDLNEFRFKKVIEAEDGAKGMNKDLDGRKGEDLIVLVPLGTTIINTETQEAIEILEQKQPILLAKGGRGQTGNHDLKSTGRDLAIREAQQPGEEKELHLVLKLIADIGLIGLPNAGKSSLLTALTRATPKIGNYPFTTLEPSLGTLNKIVIADIPGLIEGASLGKGLGIQFLKHIQKTKMLLHCIDASQVDPLKTYKTVRHEFEEYDKELLEKKEIILLTKIDLIDKDFLANQIKELKKTKKEIITVSIYDPKSIDNLKNLLIKNSK